MRGLRPTTVSLDCARLVALKMVASGRWRSRAFGTVAAAAGTGILFAILASACGDDADTNTGQADASTAGNDGASSDDGGAGGDAAAVDGSSNGDAGDAGVADRGPTVIPFPGDPEGLYWDYGGHPALYIADDTNNRIAKWTDAEGFTTAASLPPAPSGGGTFGQVVRMLDGTMLVTRSGSGDAGGGGIVIVDKTGDAGPVVGLDPTKQRVGLAIFADGTLGDSYHALDDAGALVAAVAKVGLIPVTEKDLLTGFAKPVGVIHHEGRVYVTDQADNVLVRAANDAGVFSLDGGGGGDGGGDGGGAAKPKVFASLDQPDAIAEGPDGALFVASKGGNVFRVNRDGTVSNVATGLKWTRGVAYDGAHKRLFVSEHDPNSSSHAIRIYPID